MKQEQPQYIYQTDNSAELAEQKKQAAKALLAMKGRSSTILTPDKLGEVAVNKRQLLGA
jgi:hypothetical protein